MGVSIVNAFQRRAYELYLQRVYASLKAPGYKLPFEKLRELVGDEVEVHGKEMFMPAPWHDVYACIALLQQAGLVNVSKEPQFVVIKTPALSGRQKFESLLDLVVSKKTKSKAKLPVKSIETAVEIA